MNVNVRGTIDLVRQCLPHMAKTTPVGEDGERGVVIMVASSAAFDGQPGQGTYPSLFELPSGTNKINSCIQCVQGCHCISHLADDKRSCSLRNQSCDDCAESIRVKDDLDDV